MKKFLCFQTMITPVLIQILFWVGVVACFILGITDIAKHNDILHGIQIIILGPLLLRIVAEVTIIVFKINDHLRTISNKT
jgi:hypothetical protein